jgi:hypothetical protein
MYEDFKLNSSIGTLSFHIIHAWPLNVDKSQNIVLNVIELVTTKVIYFDTGGETLMDVEMHVSLMTKVYKGSGSI